MDELQKLTDRVAILEQALIELAKLLAGMDAQMAQDVREVLDIHGLSE